MLHIEITRFLLIYTWESCKDSLLWNLRTLKSGAINRWKRFTNIWLMYSGLILISTVLIIIFEYDHFSEDPGNHSKRQPLLMWLSNHFGGQWLPLLLLDMMISREWLREINCYGLYVSSLWAKVIYPDWYFWTLHHQFRPELIFEISTDRDSRRYLFSLYQISTRYWMTKGLLLDSAYSPIEWVIDIRSEMRRKDYYKW